MKRIETQKNIESFIMAIITSNQSEKILNGELIEIEVGRLTLLASWDKERGLHIEPK